MSEKLVDEKTKAFLKTLASGFQHVYSSFDSSTFLEDTFNGRWITMSVDKRLLYLSTALNKSLPNNLNKAVSIIIEMLSHIQECEDYNPWSYMFLPCYVTCYGLDNLKTSTQAFEKITQYTSCEFAVRPYILKYPNEMMDQMLSWSTHNNLNVRRLASEGCRPSLPLATALPIFKKDPGPILPILENLKNDESDFVRKSVANNINDISKNNPSVVIKLAKSWKGNTKNTDWIIKHGCRSLLKAGIPEVMEIFGFGSVENLSIRDFKLESSSVEIGGDLRFSLQLINNNNMQSNIRLEYGVYYKKANGSLSKKVFKISEKIYPGNSITTINRKQSFRMMTTRKLHPGEHRVSIIINGIEFEKTEFELRDR